MATRGIGRARQDKARAGEVEQGEAGKAMTDTPFRPLGDKARWRILYGMLTGRQPGAVITYDEMGLVLGLDPEGDRPAIRSALARAAREYGEQDKRAIEAVPGTGYRVIAPREHLRLARRHQRRAGRSLDRGHSAVTDVDLSGMDEASRRAFELVATAFAYQQDVSRRLQDAQRRQGETIDAIVGRADRTDEEVHEIRARLARLERLLPAEDPGSPGRG